MNLGLFFELIGVFYKFIWRLKTKRKNKLKYISFITRLRDVLENTYAIVDISGYALSSQWRIGSAVGYLARIELAKKYGIKVYLMPQSFGFFSYKGAVKPVINYTLIVVSVWIFVLVTK